MSIPGFTATAALATRSGGYQGRFGASPASKVERIVAQTVWGDCSEGSPALCYFCDDVNGCACDWYYGNAYIVSSDCGTG